MLGFPARFALYILAAVSVALVMVGYFCFGLYARHFEAAALGRVQFVALQLRDTIETGLGFGVAFDEVPAAEDLIDRSVGDDPTIKSIAVYDRRGVIVFASRLTDIGRAVPADWLNFAGLTPRPTNQFRDEANLYTAVTVTNPFGDVAGGVTITVDKAYIDDQRVLFAVRLAVASCAIAGLVTLMGWLAARLVTIRTRRALARLSRSIDGLTQDKAARVVVTSAALMPIKATRTALDELGDRLRQLDESA